MESNLKMSEAGFTYTHHDIFNDNATKSKIYRHLIDINDTISEDDIRNIIVAVPGSENIQVQSTLNKEKLIAS